jgi:ribose transport system substrate-binding protein
MTLAVAISTRPAAPWRSVRRAPARALPRRAGKSLRPSARPLPAILTAILVLLSLALAACDEATPPQRPAVEGKAAPADETTVAPRVALVMKTLTNPFFLKMEQGARRAADELGAELVVRTGAQETSIEQQIAIVDELVTDNISAIVIAPGDSVRLIPAVKRAREAGIPVVNIDNRLDPDFLARAGLTDVPFVSVDNAEGAYRATRALVAAAGEAPAAAFVLEGIRGADNAEARRRGAVRAFSETPGIRIVASETANWKIDEAYDVTKRVLTAHPEITLLFAANDMMALGASRYLRDAGRFDVRVAGFDALEEARQAIATGELLATVDQQADVQGYIGVDYALRLLHGGTVPPLTLVDVVVVDSDRLTAAPTPAGTR